MTPQERELIQGLFDRIARTSGPRDPEAARLIADEVDANPEAAYYLVQAVLVQEEALKAADARIRELEATKADVPTPSSHFLDGASPWGPRPRSRQDDARTIDAPPPGERQRGNMPPPLPRDDGRGSGPGQSGGYAAPPPADNGGRPSFLRGALATAAGIAGGALLFQGISSLVGGHGLFGGGDHGGGQGFGDANWLNEDRGDISNFDREGFHDAATPDSEWSGGGSVQDANWSDDGGWDDSDWSSDEI